MNNATENRQEPARGQAGIHARQKFPQLCRTLPQLIAERQYSIMNVAKNPPRHRDRANGEIQVNCRRSDFGTERGQEGILWHIAANDGRTQALE